MASEIRIPKYLGKSASGKIILHEDAIGQGFAILGKRGKGKSVLAADMQETFASRGQSFVVLDPPDAHWGIRFKVDDTGKPIGPSGLEILLVGGEHGDVPLDTRGGKDLANTIVDGDISAVISMKHLGYTERQRFCADFAEELFRINKTPRHTFFEECQNFVMQQLKFDEQKRVLYAMEKLIEEGRGSGLGFTLISQRPALVNKNVLEQVDNMFALGVIGPNDLEQLKNWFKHHVRDKERLNALVDDLATMKMGECWFLSPEWLEEIVKFNVRMRVTYHAGRTPKVGEKQVNVKKFSVGQAVERLRKLFAEKKVERAAEVEDLAAAKKEIKRLEVELKKQPKTAPAVTHLQHSTIQKVKISKGDIRAAMQEELRPWRMAVKQLRNKLLDIAGAVKDIPELPELPGVLDIAGVLTRQKEKRTLAPPILNLRKQTQERRPYRQQLSPTGAELARWGNRMDSNGNQKLGSGALRLLAAAAGWPDGVTEGQMRAHAGLKQSGTYNTYVSRLRTAGLIEFRGGLVFATDKGMELVGERTETPRSTEDVLRIWRPKLGSGAWKIMEVLLGNGVGENGILVQHLREQAGFAERSGTFNTYLSRLKTARLIQKQGNTISLDRESLLL